MPKVTISSGPKPPKASRKKRLDLRDKVFPKAESLIYRAPEPGYCKVVHRMVPMLCVLAEHVKQPPGSISAAYVDLWLRTDDDGFVEIDEVGCAAGAGFWKKKAVAEWRNRIKTLEALELIQVDRDQATSQVRFVLVLHPIPAMERLMKGHGKKVPPALRQRLEDRLYDALGKVITLP